MTGSTKDVHELQVFASQQNKHGTNCFKTLLASGNRALGLHLGTKFSVQMVTELCYSRIQSADFIRIENRNELVRG